MIELGIQLDYISEDDLRYLKSRSLKITNGWVSLKLDKEIAHLKVA